MPFKDPERRREYAREWIRRNPERAREAMRRWRQRHPDEHNEDTRAYYARHRERLAAYFAAYRRTNRAVRRAIEWRRRARQRSAAGDLTGAQWRALLRTWLHSCAYCGAKGELQADHVIPLARGGDNSVDNCVPACASCNSRKHLLSESEFIARMRRDGRRVRARMRSSRCRLHEPEIPRSVMDGPDPRGRRRCPSCEEARREG